MRRRSSFDASTVPPACSSGGRSDEGEGAPLLAGDELQEGAAALRQATRERRERREERMHVGWPQPAASIVDR